MIDLVLKAQAFNCTEEPPGDRFLPPKQFKIAMFMLGKKDVRGRDICDYLKTTSGKLAALMGALFDKKIVSRESEIVNGSKVYLYTLRKVDFQQKTRGKGIKRES